MARPDAGVLLLQWSAELVVSAYPSAADGTFPIDQRMTRDK